MIKLSPIIKRDMNIRNRGSRLPALIVLINSILLVFELAAVFGIVTRMRLTGVMEYGTLMKVYASAVLIQFLLIAFLAPVFSAVSISEEMKKGNLDLMLMSRMTPAGIVLSKMLSGFLMIGTAVVSSLPIMLIPLLFGGIGVQDVLVSMLLLLLSLFFALCVGMFAGTVISGAAGATAFAAAVMALLLGGTVLVVMLFGNLSPEAENGAAYVLLFNPAMAVLAQVLKQISEPEVLGALFSALRIKTDSGMIRYIVPVSLLAQLACSFALYLIAVLRLTPGRKHLFGHRKHINMQNKDIEKRGVD